MTKTLIIGAGQAAAEAALSLRHQGYGGAITMITDEPHAPYERPPLSKAYLKGEMNHDELTLLAPSALLDLNIRLETNTRATAIVPAHKHVTTTKGSLDYDTLILATGARPRPLQIPGASAAGVHYLRSVADVDAIRADLETADRAVIIGGGYIGLEAAASLIDRNLDVTIVEAQARLLERVASEPISSFFHQLHVSKGVEVLTRAVVTGIECGKDERVKAVKGSFGDRSANLVIIGVGAIPNTEIAQSAGLICHRGVVVDAHCRTSDRNIYAVGDCADITLAGFDDQLRIESISNAQDSGRVAAYNIAGYPTVYDTVPWFWSDQYEAKLQMVGFSGLGDSSVVRGDIDTNSFSIFHFLKGAIIGVDAVNAPRDFLAGKRLYGRTISPAVLQDTSQTLKSLI